VRGPITLTDLDRQDAGAFGAKAVNLARLAAAGLPVPAGFALALEPGERQVADVLPAYRELGEDVRVAVRSSAVGEDGESSSFAGQHETFLGVSGEEAVVDAVARCIASTGSERAVSYRTHAGTQAGGMGVVVQVMVEAELAGVCFTRSPLEETELVVEAVRGLGESLVSGRIRPARIRYARDGLAEAGREERDGVLEQMGARLEDLVRLCLRAEEAFGCALDIEWAVAGGSIWLLQARPITAGDAGSERERIRRSEIDRLRRIAGGRNCVWTDFSVADMLPCPSTLTVEMFRRGSLFDGGIGRAFRTVGFRYARDDGPAGSFEMICGRAYLNVSEMSRAPLSDFPLVVDSSAFEPGTSFDPAAPPTRIDWRDWKGLLLAPLAALRWLALVPYRFLTLRRTFHRRYVEQVHPGLVEEASRLRAQDLSVLSTGELHERLVSTLERLATDLLFQHELSDIFAFGTHALLARNLRILYGDGAGEMESELTTGLEGNFNTESNLDLARVAAGELAMEELLRDYGHRGNPDWDVSARRWREDPDRVEEMVGIVRRSGSDPLARFDEQVRVRAGAERRFERDVGRSLVLRPWRRAIMNELRHYQRYSPLRERTQSACYLWVELARRLVLEAGRRTGGGELLFHLTLPELDRLLGGEGDGLLDAARERRRALAVARSLYVPHIVTSDDLDAIGTVPRIDPSVRELRGLPASAGTARGRARVCASLEQARTLERGEILVTASTDPAWTPLFLVAGGLVLEQGGMLSHGAIVAREYGLPAVINVEHATRLVPDGRTITVDASRGRVTIGDT
jgi:pyruvate,water dikinase